MPAEVVELADAADSKSAGVESPVRVRFPPSAPEEGLAFLIFMEVFFLRFLDFDLQDRDLDSAASELLDGVKSGKKYFVLTLNALIVYEYLRNRDYHEALERVNYVVPDGSGVLKAIKLLNKRKVGRVPGIDLMLTICKLASMGNERIYLLGSKTDTVTKTIRKLKERYPGLNIAGSHNGFFDESESDTIVAEINNSRADILFVGMGVPKQELWITKNLDGLNARILMGVGGSFDVISGNLKRAPVWMQRVGLEWFYRTVQEPRKRLRLIPKLVKFELHILKSYLCLRRGGSG